MVTQSLKMSRKLYPTYTDRKVKINLHLIFLDGKKGWMAKMQGQCTRDGWWRSFGLTERGRDAH